VPPGTYRFTHPFGSDVVTGRRRRRSGSSRPATSAASRRPATSAPAVPGLSRIARYLQCTNAPIVVNGVQYLGDPNVECPVTGSPLNQNFFRVERVESNGNPHAARGDDTVHGYRKTGHAHRAAAAGQPGA
jgi:hypothetical protein